jgi:hypothetical protein
MIMGLEVHALLIAVRFAEATDHIVTYRVAWHIPSLMNMRSMILGFLRLFVYDHEEKYLGKIT